VHGDNERTDYRTNKDKDKLNTVEPRYNEAPRDWQNVFIVMEVRYIVLFFLSPCILTLLG